MYVYYTVDTEFWPANCAKPDYARIEQDVQRDVFGLTRDQEYGIRYQMDTLEAEGLKGVFFIEALHALKLGTAFLRKIVDTVQSRGHEAALHIHPEWLGWLDEPPLKERTSQFLSDFSAGAQQWIITQGVRLMREAGVNSVVSFRGGNFGGDSNTLRALATEGVSFDSTYNVVSPQCRIQGKALFTCPQRFEGLIEVPTTFIEDYPGHYRPMQIRAASLGEMCMALEKAHERGFSSFVLVSHSFELLHRHQGSVKLDSIVRRRFEGLIKYLGRNRHKYQVTTFAETVQERLFGQVMDESPVKGSVWQTSERMLEQFLRRAAAWRMSSCLPQ
jgi:hypothetical protein